MANYGKEARPILMLKDGKVVKKFPSVCEAGRYFNEVFARNYIYNVLTKKQKYYKGYSFKYE